MEIGELVAAPPLQASEDDKEEMFECKWQDCEKKHLEDINPSYPSKGSVSKGAATSGRNYEAEWIACDLEPWKLRGDGVDPTPKVADYSSEIDVSKPRNKKMVTKAIEEFSHPSYMTQKHHVISVHLFDDFSKLAYDAKLVDYNVNDKENGICLPYFSTDIVRHDLQAHRGPHPPMYDERVSVLLRNLEEKCVRYCTEGCQPLLKRKLEAISRRVIGHIEAWEAGWYLRSTAVAERKAAYDRIGIPPPKR
jgi:hypothetical protein